MAAIASDDSLRLFDCATLQPLASALPLQHEGVTCLKPWGGAGVDADSGGDGGGGGGREGGGGDGSVLTAGRDGLVRGWDFRLGRGREKVLEMGGDCEFGLFRRLIFFLQVEDFMAFFLLVYHSIFLFFLLLYSALEDIRHEVGLGGLIR